MTELTFLIELLLHHELPAATKDLIAERIKEVEGVLVSPRPPPPAYSAKTWVAPAPAPDPTARMMELAALAEANTRDKTAKSPRKW